MWYDGFILVGTFMLRLLVPFVLTVAAGYWLEKRLGLEQPDLIELEEPELETERATRGLPEPQVGVPGLSPLRVIAKRPGDSAGVAKTG